MQVTGARRQITGFGNPTVKLLRSLRDKKHRRREQRFLAEGLRLLTDARASGRLPEMLVMAEGRHPHPLLDELETAVLAAGGEVIETSAEVLSKITGKDNPQAICGVFAQWDTGLARLDRAAAPIWLVAQAMRDPGNLGTMLRTGADRRLRRPLLGRGGARQHGGAVHSAAGAGALGRIHRLAARRAGATGRRLAARPLPLPRRPYAAPCFVMVGNESQGLPEEYEAAADLRVTMPMLGRADSLNAAVASAVLGYEVLARLGKG